MLNFQCCIGLLQLPVRAILAVLDTDAGSGQSVTDAVRSGPILRGACLQALLQKHLDERRYTVTTGTGSRLLVLQTQHLEGVALEGGLQRGEILGRERLLSLDGRIDRAYPLADCWKS